MSRRNAAPTHGWVISSQVNKWLAFAFVMCTLIAFITLWTVTYTIRRDCQRPYQRDIKLAGYWLHVESGSTKLECPQHDH